VPRYSANRAMRELISWLLRCNALCTESAFENLYTFATCTCCDPGSVPCVFKAIGATLLELYSVDGQGVPTLFFTAAVRRHANTKLSRCVVQTH